MAAMKYHITRWLSGSLSLLAVNRAHPDQVTQFDQEVTQQEVMLFVPFGAQQSGAPDQFTLELIDHYLADFLTLKWTSMQVHNIGPEEFFVTGIYIYDLGVGIAGAPRGFSEWPSFDPWPFRADPDRPRDTPQMIEAAIAPNWWFPPRPGQVGLRPGQWVSWFQDDPGDRSVIEAFNAGDFKVGIKVSDGEVGEFTYIAALPEGGNSLLLLSVGIGLLALFRRTLTRRLL